MYCHCQKMIGRIVLFGRRFSSTLAALSLPQSSSSHSVLHAKLANQRTFPNKSKALWFASPRHCHRLFCSSIANGGELSEQGEQREQVGTADGERKAYKVVSKEIIEIGPRRRLFVFLKELTYGQRFLQLTKTFLEITPSYTSTNYGRSLRISVPEDAYNFMRALDKVIVALKEAGEGKSQNAEPRPVKGRPNGILIASEQFNGIRRVIEQQLLFENDMVRYKIIGHPAKAENPRTRTLIFPASFIIELRMTLANMLEKHDGSEKLEKMPV